MFLHCHQRTQRRLDLLTIAIDELVEDLYNQLHRSADGGPHAARQ
jgi:hypothetical protein